LLTRLADILIIFRWPVIALYVVVTAVLLYFASQIGFSFSFRQFFPDDNPEVKKYFELIGDFGDDDNALMIAMEGPDIFTKKQMSRIKSFHAKLQDLSGIVEVDSIINATRPRWADDTLYIEHDSLFGPVLGFFDVSDPTRPRRMGFLHDHRFWSEGGRELVSPVPATEHHLVLLRPRIRWEKSAALEVTVAERPRTARPPRRSPAS